MAFVVPAEIGHAPYARLVLEHLLDSFGHVHVIAIRRKLYPSLSTGCWLLYASGRGRRAHQITLSAVDSFGYSARPPIRTGTGTISRRELGVWDGRLRPFLLDPEVRGSYRDAIEKATRLGDLATVGIGYVTGANEFFHLRPSEVRRLRLPERHLVPSVRSGRVLRRTRRLTQATVMAWDGADETYLLLHLFPYERLGRRVTAYLESDQARAARESLKCRIRDPWYSVPYVRVPCGFLSSMSNLGPSLVQNCVGCVGTNSVHVVHARAGVSGRSLFDAWSSDLTGFELRD